MDRALILGVAAIVLLCNLPTISTLPANKQDPTTKQPTDAHLLSYNADPSSINASNLMFPPKMAASTQIKGCSLWAQNHKVVSQIKDSIASGSKLIKFHLFLNLTGREIRGKNDSRMYKPFFWVRATGRQGTGLLLLPPTYDVLSLMTLESGVETIHVHLMEQPSLCLDNLDYNEMEELIRGLVMHDFQNTSAAETTLAMNPSDSVCNFHVLNDTGTAVFHYRCCSIHEDSHVVCKYLTTDVWLQILFVAITLLKVLVVLYSPLFIPGSVYRLKNVAAPYIHKLEDGRQFQLTTVITRNPEKHKKVRNQFKLSRFEGMPNFSTKLQELEHDVPYTLSLNEVTLRVKQGRLLPEDYAPVGLLTLMYQSFVKCKIRDRSAVRDCCESDFFSKCNCTSRVCPWYVVLKNVMTVLMFIVLATPWLVRLYVYFAFEEEEMNARRDAAEVMSLKFYYPGSVTLYLTPVHLVFVAIYILLTIESVTYGVMKRRTKEKFKLVLRKCFRDMREISKTTIIGWLVHVLLKPCTKYGGLGICVGMIVWIFGLPILMIVFSFYMFPTANITVRLFAHFFVFIFPKNACSTNTLFSRFSGFLKKAENNLEMETISSGNAFEKHENYKHFNSNLKRLQQLVIIILCLISLYSIIFLITEFVSFIVEIFVYTLMGLILNAAKLLTFFSLLVLLVLYANDVFGGVTTTFLAFNKTMHSVVLNLDKEKIEKTIFEDADTQKNTAFRMRTDRASIVENPVFLTKNPEGHPRWRITRLLLFLSKNDKPMIPKHFYFESCKMPYYSVPGELLLSYIRAAAEFGLILLFLMFVLVVVLAFGDTYEVSSTNKLLATVAGGFVPLMLRKVVFKAHSVPPIETGSIHFQKCLNELIDDYNQTWPIYDINVKSVERAGGIKMQEKISTAQVENEHSPSAETTGNGKGVLAPKTRAEEPDSHPDHDERDIEMKPLVSKSNDNGDVEMKPLVSESKDHDYVEDERIKTPSNDGQDIMIGVKNEDVAFLGEEEVIIGGGETGTIDLLINMADSDFEFSPVVHV